MLLAKSWSLSKENGLCGATCQENLRSGASRSRDTGEENPDKKKSDDAATGDVVLKMTSTLPEVSTANFVTPLPLVEHLNGGPHRHSPNLRNQQGELLTRTAGSWEALTSLICCLRCPRSTVDPEDGTFTFGGTLLQWR